MSFSVSTEPFFKFFPEQDEYLEVKNDLLALLFELEDYGITMFNAAGYVISCNIGAEKIFGIKREDLIGRHFSGFYSSEGKELGQPEHNLKQVSELGRIEYEGWKYKEDKT